jgi:hypothetical protein
VNLIPLHSASARDEGEAGCAVFWDLLFTELKTMKGYPHHNSSKKLPEHNPEFVKWTIDPDSFPGRDAPHVNDAMGYQFMTEGDNPLHHPPCSGNGGGGGNGGGNGGT